MISVVSLCHCQSTGSVCGKDGYKFRSRPRNLPKLIIQYGTSSSGISRLDCALCGSDSDSDDSSSLKKSAAG